MASLASLQGAESASFGRHGFRSVCGTGGGSNVRMLGGLAVVLLIAGWWACTVEIDVSSSGPTWRATRAGGWRRTSQGWENATNWWPTRPAGPRGPAARIHPLLFTMLVTATTLAALAQGSAAARRRHLEEFGTARVRKPLRQPTTISRRPGAPSPIAGEATDEEALSHAECSARCERNRSCD